ncbi:MBOAT family O-acyltransferase [Ramlibacter montanisoli]|uniref:MBOAT family O-acyltransferase n=1 Tax=Ramlibacter montanisoli TaxID=2732512 RepID=UPI00281541A1|nr:MBOAT family protein [Ramlibacter montanisoli]
MILPLGISFYTFTQIAFLVDTYQGKVTEFNFFRYALFVTWFPHLIAGPVLHHAEMMPQFARKAVCRIDWQNVAVGLSIFVLGLAKKVLLADSIAEFASPVFDGVKAGAQPMLFEAWVGALAYTLQLYLDFSAYSDMAIGLSLMFNVRLPLNFDSPYKATSIIDFWRRWHMTLSRFLRDYLYIPLGGGRAGNARRYANLMTTMVLGGLWHGAGWTFVVWGTLHGCYLLVNHAWRAFRRRHGWGEGGRAAALAAGALTFLAVVVGWVFFRADSMASAVTMLQGMTGMPAWPWPTRRPDCSAPDRRWGTSCSDSPSSGACPTSTRSSAATGRCAAKARMRKFRASVPAGRRARAGRPGSRRGWRGGPRVPGPGSRACSAWPHCST